MGNTEWGYDEAPADGELMTVSNTSEVSGHR